MRHSEGRVLPFPEARLLVFAKAPVPGQVKTRLIPFLNPADAARLYTRLLLDTLSRVHRDPLCPVELWCSPTFEHPVFEACKQKFPISLHQQVGDDLGQRMHYAVCQALNKAASALLIGCDCPELDVEYLRGALFELKQGYQSVLGPAEDGGYVLLGLRRPVPELFNEIAWGTDRVLVETRLRLTRMKLSCFELQERWDLDRPDDLERYFALSRTTNNKGLDGCGGKSQTGENKKWSTKSYS